MRKVNINGNYHLYINNILNKKISFLKKYF